MIIIDTNNPYLSEVTLSERTRQMILKYLKQSNPKWSVDNEDNLLQTIIDAEKEEYSTKVNDYLISFPDTSPEELKEIFGDPLENLMDEAHMFYENENSPPRYLPYI